MGSLGHGYIDEVMVLANAILLEYIYCTELSSMYPCPEVIREGVRAAVPRRRRNKTTGDNC